MIRDNNSKNGTFVNGLRVTDKVLSEGDRITIGSTSFLFVPEHGDSTGARPALPQEYLQAVQDYAFWSRQRAKLKPAVFVGASILLLILVCAYLTLGPKRQVQAPTRPQNLLVKNPSFEEVGQAKDPSGWHPQDQYQSTRAQPSELWATQGNLSLKVDKLVDPAEFVVEYQSEQPLRISGYRALKITGWVKIDSPGLWASIKVSWYIKGLSQAFLEEMLKPASYNAGRAVKLYGRLEVPTPVDYAKISLCVIGRQGSVYFDDIYVEGEEGTPSADPCTLDGFRLQISNSGAWALMRGELLWITNARLWSRSRGGFYPHGLFLRGAHTSDPSSIFWSSLTLEPLRLEKVGLREGFSTQHGRLLFSFVPEPKEADPSQEMAVLMNLPHPVQIETISKPASITLHKQGKELRISTSDPVEIQYQRQNNSLLLILLFTAPKVLKEGAQIVIYEPEESRIQDLHTLSRLAGLRMRQGRYGEAYSIYKKMVNLLKDPEGVKRYQVKMAEIERLARRRWEDVDYLIRKAKLLRRLEAIDQARQGLEEFQHVFGELASRYTDIKGLHTGLNILYQEVKTAREEAQASRLLRLARGLYQAGQQGLTNRVCKYILRHYPQTKAASQAEQFIKE